MLDRFTLSYLDTALWSSTDDDGSPLDESYGIDDFTDEFIAEAKQDCAAFIAANEKDIAGKYARAGHDFWLTRNHHGAGFWDGDWPKDIGERLTEASHAFGTVDLYVGDDGQIYS